jgi:putative dimethyl sulfoxide reductase chaperone
MNAATPLHRPEVQHVLGRAAVYQLLSLGFAYPDQTSLTELRAYVRDVSEHEIVGRLGITELLRHLDGALDRSDAMELAAEHNRLFAGEVLCSAHETEYAFDPFAKSRQLADIAGFYRAFGLQVAHDRRGLPDFIATELEFVSLLLRKQAYAGCQGWAEHGQVTDGAVHSFLEDHLGRWVSVLCTDVGREARDAAGFYAAVAELCDHFIADETERTGIRPDRVRSRSRSRQDATPFQCPLDSNRPCRAPTPGETAG